MAARILIDTAVIDREIGALRIVRDLSPAATQGRLLSVGRTARIAGQFPAAFHELDLALDALIDSTIAFLENARDTFIDVDEAGAAAFARLMEEVG